MDDEKAPRCGAFSLTTRSRPDIPSIFSVSEFHDESVDDRTRKRHSTPSGVEQRFNNRNDYAASKSSPSSGSNDTSDPVRARPAALAI